MILTLTVNGPDACDLGYLLHKNPANVHSTSLASGQATVFYSEAEPQRCTAVLLVEVDPVALVRSPAARQSGWALGQYVNDRPYVASSFLSTAISRVYGSALNGRCEKRPDLITREFDLTVHLPTFAAPGGQDQVERLFGPLGYDMEVDERLLDGHFEDWGLSRHRGLILRKRSTVQEVLRQLFVLIPTFDNNKHYWVSSEDIQKLIDKGGDWLPHHPELEWITSRFLKHQRSLTREALAKLIPEVAEEVDEHEEPEAVAEKKLSLHVQRLERVTEIITGLNVDSVVDLGCGTGKLLTRLLRQTKVSHLLGMDVDSTSLERAKEHLLDRTRGKNAARLKLIQGSLIYQDDRLCGFDVATLIEVIEHLEPHRLEALELAVFSHAKPRHVIVTTPNIEYNVLFENLTLGHLRHGDHRFEWTSEEFSSWAEQVAERHGYDVTFEGLGEAHPEHGSPSQLAHFAR